VILSSIRGGELLSDAPSGKPLQLNIEAPDLVSGQAYRIRSGGCVARSVWTATATDAGGRILAQIPKRLMSGMYWVRLYDEDRQLREFRMSVK
jgi:hypothetical protein